MKRLGTLRSFVLVAGVLLVSDARAQQTPTTIVFAAGPDDTGTVARIVDEFNRTQAGKVRVEWREMPRNSNEHRKLLVSDFNAGSGSFDVVASDVVWTAEFAQQRWVRDVTRRFHREYESGQLLDAAVESASYRLRVWGVPWYSDVGILYYRKDLLDASGFASPPETWAELKATSQKVQQDARIRHGFVFQGAQYEGGTVNAAEFIWSAGGRILRSRLTVVGLFGQTAVETDDLLVNSPESARGIDAARSMIVDGVAPPAVSQFREKEAVDLFLSGDAVFLRSWPYTQGLLARSELKPEQVGVAPLPGLSKEVKGHSCLGGWNLMISAQSSSTKRDAAWTFIRFLTDPRRQKHQALEAGLLPVVTGLYDDQEIIDRLPVVALGRDVLVNRVLGRPQSPHYAEISERIAHAFHRSLQGELNGAQAVELMETELKEIMGRYR
ncbi:MAG: ABC transporter substrate-binding protein [Myxococcota bacterium]